MLRLECFVIQEIGEISCFKACVCCIFQGFYQIYVSKFGTFYHFTLFFYYYDHVSIIYIMLFRLSCVTGTLGHLKITVCIYLDPKDFWPFLLDMK